MTRVMSRAGRAIWDFLWDFLIGDTPELALAVGVIVALAFLVTGTEWLGAILLPVLAAGFLLASTLRGRRRAPAAPTPPDA
jgi:hypothetical protein